MTYLICAVATIIIVATYPKWSYIAWNKRMTENAKHPDFIPFSGKKHI